MPCMNAEDNNNEEGVKEDSELYKTLVDIVVVSAGVYQSLALWISTQAPDAAAELRFARVASLVLAYELSTCVIFCR